MSWKLAGPVFLVSLVVGMGILKSNSDEDEKLTSVARFAYEFWDSNGHWPNKLSELDLDRWQSRTVSYSNVVLAHPRHLSRNPATNREIIVVYQYTGKRLWPYRFVGVISGRSTFPTAGLSARWLRSETGEVNE